MARLRPSSADRWGVCPASVQMQELFPETGESEEAREGTAAHWVAEQILQSYKNQDGSIILSNEFEGKTAPNGVMITEEMMNGADAYVNHVLKTVTYDGSLQYLNIEKTRPMHRIHATECEGTSDADFYNPETKTIYLWDYKFGHAIVEAVGNRQLVCYACGILEELQKLPNYDDRQITVKMFIVQPRGYHSKGTIRMWECKASDLRGYINTLHTAGGQALNTAPTMQSNKSCKTCTAIASCKSANRSAAVAIDCAYKMEIEVIPDDQLKYHREVLQRGKDAIEARLTGIEAQIQAKIMFGHSVPGLALDNPLGNLKWNYSYNEMLAFAAAMSTDDKKIDLRQKKLITPTQAKDRKLIDESVINVYASRSRGSTKIVNSDETTAAKIFKQ